MYRKAWQRIFLIILPAGLAIAILLVLFFMLSPSGALAAGGRQPFKAVEAATMLSAPAAPAVYTGTRINEIRIDQPSTDNDEYFELSGPAGADLTSLTYLVIGDGAGGSGVIEAVVALTGTMPGDGLFLAVESTFSLTNTQDLTTSLNFENSDNVTHLLVSGFSGANGNDLDTDDDGVLDATPWASQLDCVALIETVGSGDLVYCSTTVGPDGVFVPGHVYRCPTGWQIGGFSLGTDDTPGAPNNCPPADMTVSKRGPAVALPGEVVTYTLTYANVGGDVAANVVLTDALPAYVTYLADDSGLPCPACVPGATGTLTWTGGTISDTNPVSFSLAALITNTVPSGETLTNTFGVATSSPEGSTANNQAQWPLLISPVDLVVGKQAPVYGAIGDALVYNLSLEAAGVASATNVILTDTLPLSVTYVADDSGLPCLACVPGASGTLTWTVGDIPSNTLVTIDLTVTVDVSATSGQVLVNQVTASTDSPSDIPANNSATAQTTVYPLVTIYDVQTVSDPASDDASPLVDQVVWVEGVVTAEPGEIDNPTRLMVIQDPGGGAYSGLPLFRASGFTTMAPEGTQVRALGTVDEFFGFTELGMSSDPWDLQVLGSGALISPQVISTGGFDDSDPAISEPWESVLLEFRDATVTDDNLGFGEWHFDDGTGNARADDLGGRDGDLNYTPTNGDFYTFIRGIGWYSFGNYKLAPRYDADIAVRQDSPQITKSAPQLVAPGELYTYTLAVFNSVGYTLTDVVVSDPVPAGTTFAYVLDGGVQSGGVVTWTAATLPDQGNLTLRFAVTATLTSTTIVNENYAVVASNFITPTVGPAVGTVVGNRIAIHNIQAARHFSPFEGQVVADVHGIVTAVGTDSPGSQGFFLQDPNPDGDEATSEGIFVFTGSAPTVNVGDEVLVTGEVDEYYHRGAASNYVPTTQLINPTVVVSTTGNPLPAPVVIGNGGRVPPNQVIDDDANGDVTLQGSFDAASDGLDFYESLEGMLLQVNDALVVGGNRFGEIAVVGDNGANAGTFTLRGGLVVQPDDFNPERIIIDDALFATEPDYTVGDAFTDIITGVLDYSFGNYKLLNPNPLPPLAPSGLVSETTTLTGTQDQLTVVTFNVENLDPEPGDGDDDNAKFVGLANEIVDNLGAPDIIGLEEIQDNNGAIDDGTVDASLTYSTLIVAIQAAGGPTYDFRDIPPLDKQDGGQPGGNIRVGFLFRPDRVTFVDRPGGGPITATTVLTGPTGVELSASPGRVDPTNPAFDDSRKSLAGEFLFNGNKVFVVVNHFKSKSGDDPLFGRIQPPVQTTEDKRSQQAQAVNDFADAILALDPAANVVVLGDLNDFQFSTALATLEGGVLTNLHDNLPLEEQYSFIFDGNSQVLDHILVSDNLVNNATPEFDIVHANADYDPDFRPTDHDPLVARLSLPVPPARLQLAHLAPFAMDPGTAVTVTLNGTAVLTGFEFADSTGYLSLVPGSYLVEVFPGGSVAPAITATVDLITGTDYTAIAIGDGANQPLDLLVLTDDNTSPPAGFAKLRIGHLAPFAAVITDTLADVRLQDGTLVLNDVPYGTVDAGYSVVLPAGTYDLKITSADGSTTLIDPLPVSLQDGDVLSVFAVGDGANQSLGVFALPAGQPGFLLPLFTGYRVYLPGIWRMAVP